ncbi:hypothetical protein AAFC00_004309 [Neodothiora populina]|uniref:AMP-dependent synthetase/ligase domain-containing protein n=1 Tax=Neodothiora populina TaxID=2781224 RepID=A0ABR3PJA0_9PEZI
MFSTIPIFHVFGIWFALTIPGLSPDVVVLLGPARGPPSVELAETVLDYGKPDGAVFPPFLIEAASQNPRAWAKLKTLDLIIYGGAPLSERIGHELAKTTNLWGAIGCTEGCGFPGLVLPSEDWDYFRFHPFNGIEFEQQGDLNLYEMVIKKTPTSNHTHGIFRSFPDQDVYRIKDLYTRHPAKPDLYKYSGRTDDLVLLTGEVKLYAKAIEDAVRKHAYVKDVIVGGDKRIVPFMLVELDETHGEVSEDVIDDFWGYIEGVNQRNAESAMIRQDLTIFTQKPFKMTPKGSVERRTTLEEHQATIDNLYIAYEAQPKA